MAWMLPTTVLAAKPEPTPSPRREDPSVQEVRVQGARKEAGARTMRGAEIRQMPGAFGDAFRAIEALPGVTPVVSGVPYFFVRGAPPGNTGTFLDGVRVPLLYHLAFGPSVIHPGLIEDVSFYPGGYPARFGRFSGGILAAETTPPPLSLRGEYNVRLFDAGALVEAPVGKATVMAAGRYGYPGLLLSLFAPSTSLQYWDYQARATLAVTPKEQVSVFAFGSFDALSERRQSSGRFEQVLATQFHRVDMRYDRVNERGRTRVALTLGLDQTGDDSGDVHGLMGAVRMQTEERFSKTFRGRGGLDMVLDRYALSRFRGQSSGDDLDTLYPPRNDIASGVWADAVLDMGSRVQWVLGLRGDYFGSKRYGVLGTRIPLNQPGAASKGALDPRMSVRVRVGERSALVSTFGVSHQPPSFLVPIPGLAPGRLAQGLQTSVQMGQGIEVALPEEFLLQATGFLHQYLGLTDMTATCGNAGRSEEADECATTPVRGRAFGVEVLLKRPLTKRLTGWLAYTLSRSTRQASPLFGFGRAEEIPSEFDRTHVVNLVGAYDLGRRWRVGGRLYYYSGRPYSQEVRGIPVPPYNQNRLPGFARLDARLEKRWVWGSRRALSLVFEWMNVLLNKEAIGTRCTTPDSEQLVLDECSPQYVGPVTIPSVGIEGRF